MDKGSIIIGLGIIILVVLPFVLPSFFKHRRENRLKNRLRHMAGKAGFEVSESDVWGKIHAIGIDDRAERIIYYSALNNSGTPDIISLNDVGGCRIVQADSTQKCQYGGPQTAYRLFLVFTFNESSRGEKAIEFYNNASFAPVDHDMTLIEKWVGIVRQNLKKE